MCDVINAQLGLHQHFTFSHDRLYRSLIFDFEFGRIFVERETI